MASQAQAAGDMHAAEALYAALYAPGPSGQKNEPVRYDARGRRMLCDMLNEAAPGSSYARPKYAMRDGSIEAAVSGGIRAGMIQEDGGMISLTAEGARAAARLWGGLDDETKEAVSESRELYGSFTDDEALVFSYCDYPERADAAGERAEFERLRLECAISMHKGQKVTLERASEVSGMRYVDFLDEVKRRGIPLFIMDEESYAMQQKARDIFATVTS